jgi:hypothetical protein
MRTTMFNQRKMRRPSLALAFIGALASTQPAEASELFLIPDKSVVSIQSQPLIRLVGDAFVKGDAPIEQSSLLSVTVAGNGRLSDVRPDAWYADAECIVTSASTLCGGPARSASKNRAVSILKYRVGDAGTYVVDAATAPRTVNVSASDLAAHLRKSGAPAALEPSGPADPEQRIRERQTSFARAIVQVLDQRTADYARVFKHSLEIVLEQNPYDRNLGDPLALRVLRSGKPAINQLVRVGYRDQQAVPPGRVDAYELHTDNEGRTSFLLSTRGLWYVSVLDLRKSPDRAVDYDATWATVTFRTK